MYRAKHLNHQGSAATKIVIGLLAVVLLVFGGFQAIALVMLNQEHQRFQQEIETQVQGLSTLHIPETQTQLTKEIVQKLDGMNAQYEPHHIQINIEKAQESLQVQIWYARRHSNLFVPNPKQFYITTRKSGFSEIVEKIDLTPTPVIVTQATPSEESQPQPTPTATPEPVESKPLNVSPVTLTSSNFNQEVLRSPIPVMVNFWASWCGYCRKALPSVNEAAREFAGQVKVAKLNIDQSKSIASKYGIQGIPTFIVFKDGKRVGTRRGFLTKYQLFEFIREHTSKT